MEHQPAHRGRRRGAAQLTDPAAGASLAAVARPDTIVAIATPPGRGGIGIVRLSGPKVPELAAVLLGELPRARHATLARFQAADGSALDAGLALFFPAPHSYTGEHVLELQGHGGPLVLEALEARALELGARRAQPGEFTQRAFLNDKLDLAQAEAVADLIAAGSRCSSPRRTRTRASTCSSCTGTADRS